MEVTASTEAYKSQYTYVIENAEPYLEIYSNWARLRYKSKDKDKIHDAVVCFPLSSVFTFNWKKIQTEQGAAANP